VVAKKLILLTSIYSRPIIKALVLLEVAVVGSSVPSKAAGVPLDALAFFGVFAKKIYFCKLSPQGA